MLCCTGTYYLLGCTAHLGAVHAGPYCSPASALPLGTDRRDVERSRLQARGGLGVVVRTSVS